MSLPRQFADLRAPIMAAPMFIVSSPALVIAQCEAGIVGSMPALNARTDTQLDEWIGAIATALGAYSQAHPAQPAAPFAINQIAHRSNDRLARDTEIIVKHRVPIVIISLSAHRDIVDAVHGYGGLVFNDVISDRHARRAIDNGCDGLIAVAAGAGGHTGHVSPFALLEAITSIMRFAFAESLLHQSNGGIRNGCKMIYLGK